ncbi:CPBP family glutamic-type intramembrane protease [Tenacibaculum amylolyticum]|uniref:CPBP family glutamic-type intramembrane protease n=1 Tax=Tenacibaculum amylolyticum TaxID=104269 RepID=UPI0038B492B2
MIFFSKTKAFILKYLDFLKNKSSFKISVFLLLLIVTLQLVYTKNIYEKLIILFSSITVTYFYFISLYFLLDKEKFLKIVKPTSIINYYRKTNLSYFKKQVNGVFIEEVLFRLLPMFFSLIIIGSFPIWAALLVILFFTLIHRFENIIVLLEFFLFFMISYIIYIKTKDFSVIFFSHLIRNLIIEYLINNK